MPAGRPEFQPTDEMRRRVAIAAGSGRMNHEEIATGLDISRNTLEKHFERELSVGAYEKRLEVLEAMHVAALKGNIAAQKAYVEDKPRAAAPPLKPIEEKQPALGKKQQANVDAVSAAHGTEWEDLLPAQPTQ